MSDLQITWLGTSDMRWLPNGIVVPAVRTCDKPVTRLTIYPSGWLGSLMPSWPFRAARQCPAISQSNPN